MRAAFAIVLLLSGAAFATGPLERNHPLVEDGMKAFDKQDFESALKSFDAAREVLPNNALVEYNRGAALHKLGRNDEAKEALLRAAELDKGELQGPIHYNLGNVWAATGNKKEAVTEYRKALRVDPNDQLARHNLEVVLRDLQKQNQSNGSDGGSDGGHEGDAGKPDAGSQDGGKPQDGGRPQDGGTKPDGGSPDGGGDGGSDGGQQNGPDGGKGDGGQGDGGQGDKPKPGDGGSSPQGGGDAGRMDAGSDTKDAGSEGEEEVGLSDGGASMSKKDAEKLLDSMKNSEKNLQLWRFQQKRKKNPNGKDW